MIKFIFFELRSGRLPGRFLLWAVCFLLTACSNNQGDEPAQDEVVDSVEHAHSIYTTDSLLATNKDGDHWLANNLQLQNAGWRNVELEDFWNGDTLEMQPFDAPADFYKDYAPVLFWSPDSSYILDIGSYGHMVVTDEKGQKTLEGGEPDTEISIILPRNNEKARLMFAGPASNVISARWADSTQAIILGTFNHETGDGKDTLLWLIDIKDKFFRLYNFKNSRVKNNP